MTQNPITSVQSAVSFAGEAVLPGGSNLLKGDLKQGGLHLLAGILARSAFGVPGVLLVSANSFVKATTGRQLYEHLGLWQTPAAAEPTTRPETTGA